MLDKLAIKNAEIRRRRLLRIESSMRVKPGWIKYIRTVLGMTLKDLSKLANLSLSTVAQAERGEVQGKISIDTLKKFANAMECEFVYAFIPKNDISDTLHKKAIEKAKRTILKVDIHMSLEDQKVTENINFRIKTLAEKLLEKGKIW